MNLAVESPVPGPLLLYTLAGLVQDVIIVKYYLALQSRRMVLAPVLGALITVLTVGVYEGLITSRDPVLILGYGLGTGLGTLLGLIGPRRAPTRPTSAELY
jgi:hypothetical protein